MPTAYVTRRDSLSFNALLRGLLRSGAGAVSHLIFEVGGVFDIYDKTLKIGFQGNNTLYIEGAGWPVILRPAWTFNVTDSSLVLNGVTLDGSNLPLRAPILNCTTFAVCRISDSRVIGCKTERQSPITAWGSQLHLTSTSFESNQGENGGAVSTRLLPQARQGFVVQTRIQGCRFRSNIATERGGAVYVEHGHLYIGSTSFEGNKADGGGALAVLEADDSLVSATTVVGSYFGSNSATCSKRSMCGGGAIWNVRPLTVADSVFEHNKVAVYDGGAILSSGRLRLRSTTFTMNTAAGRGGGVCQNDSLISVDRCLFSSNVCQAAGGALQLTESQVGAQARAPFSEDAQGVEISVIKDSEFRANRVLQMGSTRAVPLGGGALHTEKALLVLKSSFSGNDVAEGGRGSSMRLDGAAMVRLVHSRVAEGDPEQVYLGNTTASIFCQGTLAVTSSTTAQGVCGMLYPSTTNESRPAAGASEGVWGTGSLTPFLVALGSCFLLLRVVDWAIRWAWRRAGTSRHSCLVPEEVDTVAMVLAALTDKLWPFKRSLDAPFWRWVRRLRRSDSDDDDESGPSTPRPADDVPVFDFALPSDPGFRLFDPAVPEDNLVLRGRRSYNYRIMSASPVTSSHLAEVYLAWDVRNDRTCMIKLYRAGQNAELAIESEKHFLSSAARKSIGQNHRTFLLQYADDFLHERAGYFLVLSPVCVESLEGRLARASTGGELDYGAIVLIVYEIVQGLRALAKIRLVHGQLCLANVLLTSEGHVRLMDFGVPPSSVVRQKLQRHHELWDVVPPECRLPHETEQLPTSAMDCWNLGYIAYMLACKSLTVGPPGTGYYDDNDIYVADANFSTPIDPRFKACDRTHNGSFTELLQLFLQEDPSRRLTVASADLVLKQIATGLILGT